jgi:hypothetical protein
MATFCDMAYTWDANKNKTSETITCVMSVSRYGKYALQETSSSPTRSVDKSQIGWSKRRT